MESQTQTEKKKLRRLLVKRPFYRTLPDVQKQNCSDAILANLGEKTPVIDRLMYTEVTQADFLRELDPNSHAINDRSVYINYRYNDKDGLLYEEDFPRYAFAYQQEILDDRLSRLTGNDIQFDLADKRNTEETQEAFSVFKEGWADKRMENAWHFAAKSDLSTGDTAFVGFMVDGKFGWRVFSYANGDELFPHYDRRTGKMNVFARTYSDYDDYGDTRDYIDVWDDKYYYRLVADNGLEEDDNNEDKNKGVLPTLAGDFDVDGYILEYSNEHGAPSMPVSYHRRDDGPAWSPSQESIEHREAAFSRLAQNNHDFGLPILGLYGSGKKIQEVATSDMSYASKVFIIPADGKAEFLNRQDASNAYKTELDMLEAKIYSQSMVIKAPELKSGDTPAAAIKLLYSDAYNKAMLEAQEYDAFICKMIDIFKWFYGIESEKRLIIDNTRISFYIVPFLPVNDQEVTTNLATAVQNGFCSKKTASEKFYFSTPQEWKRIQDEKREQERQELLLEEQKLDIHQENNIETQQQLSDIQAEQQIEVLSAQADIENGGEGDSENDDDDAKKVRSSKGNVATGRGRGRPRTVGTDKWGNRANENNWQKWNQTH